MFITIIYLGEHGSVHTSLLCSTLNIYIVERDVGDVSNVQITGS